MNVKGLPALERDGAAPESQFWSTAQLAQAGMSDRDVRKSVRAGRLKHLRRGYYANADQWKDLTPKDREVQQILAHAQALGGKPAGAYSHGTAARLHGLCLWQVEPLIHLTQSFKSSSSKGPVDVRRHFRQLATHELTTVRSLPVTTLERTVVDCAASLGYRQALIIADHATRLGADQEQMSHMVSAMNGVCGVKAVRRVLADLNPLSESPGETLTRVLIMETGLDMPQLQLKVSTRSGEHRLDFGWEDASVAIEFDGDTKYFDYEPAPKVLLAERKREKALMEQGWVFVRLEWKDLFQPREMERRVHEAFRKASWMRRPDHAANGVAAGGINPRPEPRRNSVRAS